MKMTTNTLVSALGMLLLMAGCGGDSPEEILRDIADQQDQATVADCGCFWNDYGYDSSAQCVTDNLITVAERDCVVEAVRPVAAINPEHFRCVRRSFERSLACIESARCDEDAIDACFAMSDVCPDNPCAGLTGDRFDECQIEFARANATIDECD